MRSLPARLSLLSLTSNHAAPPPTLAVKTPAEAILDSRALMAVSDAGALKARQMKLDANAFDTDDFLAKLVLFMGGRVGAGGNNGKGRAQATQEDDDEDEDDDGGLKWDRVGRVLAGHSRRPPTMDLMCVRSLLSWSTLCC